MAGKKQGVGIWDHYRTTDRADGFETRFRNDGMHYHAKLFWAPADWRNPDDGGKRANIVVWVSPSGKMNSFGRYEDELRNSMYVSDEFPRRNWKKLCEIAEGIGVNEIMGMAADALRYHDAMVAHGCTFERGTYYFPIGSDPNEVMAAVRADLANDNANKAA